MKRLGNNGQAGNKVIFNHTIRDILTVYIGLHRRSLFNCQPLGQ